MLGLFPNALYTPQVGQSGGRGLSPRLWSRVDGQALAPDGASNGYMIADDFLSFGGTVATNVGTYSNGYKSYEDNSNTITQVATEVGGVLRFTGAAADNNESWLQSGYSTGVLGKISDTAGSDKLMIFEARFRVSSVVDDVCSLFLGLTEEGLAAQNTKVDDTGVFADKDRIGFETVHTNGGTTGTNAALNFIYEKAGQTAQTLISGVKTLVADTWYKVGFVYDPAAEASKRIRVYVDNVEQSTYVTATQIATATFPDGEELAFLAGMKAGTATASNLDLDWWAFYQAG